MSFNQIVIWQTEVSPHMYGLAVELTKLGFGVSYIAEEKISAERKQLGWETKNNDQVETILIKDRKHAIQLVGTFHNAAIHLVQGVRGNGIMPQVRDCLIKNGCHWGAVMEAIDERSWKWPLKRLVYRFGFSKRRGRPDFILAIGNKTSKWIAARGYPEDQILPFCYFIPALEQNQNQETIGTGKFQFGYIGQLIPRKRVDLLIDAIAGLNAELTIVGDGPLREGINFQATNKLQATQFDMLGTLPMGDIGDIIRGLDCLVLPSDHDGWGAVVSEALLAGVPAICSDACGAAEAVYASGVGGVFPKGDATALRNLLSKEIAAGKLTDKDRKSLSKWARCLNSTAGGGYLNATLAFVYNDAEKPIPPWLATT